MAEFERQGFKPEDKDDDDKMGRLVFASERDPKRPRAINGLWIKALHKSRITDFRLHDLRHSCASYLAQNGGGLLEMREVLGPSSLKMSARYSRLTTEHKSKLIHRVLGHIGEKAA